jgi:hypothetical protein
LSQSSFILDTYILPKWGDFELRKVKTTQVEKWLRKLMRIGKSKGQLARGSKAKIRSVMSVLFNHAIRHELMPQGSNPITMVQQSAKRMQTPDILEVGELGLLFNELSHRERVMVLLDAIKMTLEVYAQAVTPAKRQAQSKVAGMLKEKVGAK